MVLAVGILVLIAFSLFSYWGLRAEKRGLEEELGRVQQELVEARKAREEALVRLMVLEGPSEPEEKPATDERPPEEASEGPPSADAAAQETEAKGSAAAEVGGTEEETRVMTSAPVSVEKLEIERKGEKALFDYRFIVKKVGQDARVKGYTFLVLQPEEGSEEPPLVRPLVPLENGRPASFEKGQFFSITRYKPVSGSFTHEAVEWFTRATVYVFSEDGEVMVEKVFELNK
jgi:hypothetical protein